MGITLFGQYNQGIRLHRAHLELQFRKEVTTQGAYVENVEFLDGRIYLKVHHHRDDGCLWVGIHVDVWSKYSLMILNETPNMLRARLHRSSYTVKYEIDNCWPICGDIESDVKEQINQELPKYSSLTFPFADLCGVADRACSAIEPYGLTIYMEVPNA